LNIKKNGDIISCSWYNTPLLDKDGKVHGVASLVDDITQVVEQENKIKEALTEKELLLKEIHHRVKNNLQIVTSLLNMQSDLVKDDVIKGYFKISADRVRAMALIHQQLYGSVNISQINFEFYLKDLVSHLFKLYCTKPDKIKIIINTPGITMDIDNAVPCGLLVNEIITNSFKHAFPGERKGEIKIDMKMSGEEYILKINDNGVGTPDIIDINEKKGLGNELIKMLSEQLDANMEIKRDNGTEYIFTFKALTYKKRV
jgi:two-component sensor histidine kinase